jgi:polar amino acid transport system substrate-binding protein
MAIKCDNNPIFCRQISVALLIVGLCFSVLSAPSQAQNSQSQVQQNLPSQIKIVRGIGNYPPLEMMERGSLTGLHIEMIRHVANRLGIKVEFISLPWGRAIKYFEDGRAHAISYFGYTKKREQFSYYHDDNVLSNTRWVLLALESRKNEFKFDRNLLGLSDVVIGVQNQYSHGAHFDNMTHLNRDAVISEFDLERMLKNKRHDLAMMSYQEFMGFKARGDFQGIVALSPMIDTDPQYLAFSKAMGSGENAILAKRFSIEFKKFKSSNNYQKLLKQFNFQH